MERDSVPVGLQMGGQMTGMVELFWNKMQQ